MGSFRHDQKPMPSCEKFGRTPQAHLDRDGLAVTGGDGLTYTKTKGILDTGCDNQAITDN